MKQRFALLALLLVLAVSGFSQKQVVLVKGGNTVARFGEGQYFRCVLKKNHRHAEGHIIELNDFSMITSNDTIQFRDILKIDIHKQRSGGLLSNVGKVLVIIGVGYIGLDRLNYSVNNIGSPTLDNSVITTSAICIGAGAAMILIRPRYQHVNNGYFLHTIDYASPFYQH